MSIRYGFPDFSERKIRGGSARKASSRSDVPAPPARGKVNGRRRQNTTLRDPMRAASAAVAERRIGGWFSAVVCSWMRQQTGAIQDAHADWIESHPTGGSKPGGSPFPSERGAGTPAQRAGQGRRPRGWGSGPHQRARQEVRGSPLGVVQAESLRFRPVGETHRCRGNHR